MCNSRLPGAATSASKRGQQLADASDHIISHCKDAILSFSDEEYIRAGRDGASIGAHIRHTLEYFQVLVSQAASGCVDYASRARNPAIENSRQHALAAFDSVRQSLHQLAFSSQTGQTIEVLGVSGADLSCVRVSSTVERELMMVIEHAVHHMALIKLIALETSHRLPEHFGLAPSTRAYRQTLEQ